MNRIIVLLALLPAVPVAWLVFGQALDLNAAVAPTGPEDALFDNLPQIRAVTIIGTKSCAKRAGPAQRCISQ